MIDPGCGMGQSVHRFGIAGIVGGFGVVVLFLGMLQGMGLGAELTLLAVHAGTSSGGLNTGPSLDYALVVAELVDLAAAGRIAVHDGVIEVLDRMQIGEALSDDSLARIADLARNGGPGATVAQWVESRGQWRVRTYLAGLRYEHVVREPSTPRGPAPPIEIADTLRAEAVVRRLRTLMDTDADPASVQDLAFAVLAGFTDWPRVHLRVVADRRRRERLKQLSAAVAGSRGFPRLAQDPALPLLREGLRAVRRLSRAAELEPSPAPLEAARFPRPSRPARTLFFGRWLIVVVYLVGMLAAATLVLAVLRNLDLSIIIAPFLIPLIAAPIVHFCERLGELRRRLRS
jgi:hypothetical protein